MAGLNENIMIRLMADTSNYTTRMQAASAQAEKLSTALEKPMTTGEKVSAGLTKTGLAVGAVATAVGVAAVSMFANFDAAMSTVQANTGASADEMGQLRQAALDAGASTVYSASEAADAINELGKAGMSTSDILSGGLSGALDLAASDGMEVSEAAELMSSAMAQFNLTGAQAGQVADALAAGAGKAQGSAHDLGYALQQSGMVANSFGIGMDETVGALTAFANAGMIGSDAGTSLKTMLIALANPSKKASELMDELGIHAYDAQGNFIGLEGLAGQLKTQMSGLSQEQRNQALATIFGSDAIRAANVLYNEGAEGVKEWTEKVSDSGYAAEQAAAKNNNLKGDIENLNGSVETMLITIGSGANGILRNTVQTVDMLVDSFTGLPAPVQQGAIAVGMAVGAFAGLHKLFGNLATSSSGMARGIGLAIDPVQRLTGLVGALQTSAGQLGAAFSSPLQRLETFGTTMSRKQAVMTGFKTAAGGVVDLLGGPWGIALTMGAAALTYFASETQKAKANAEEFQTAIETTGDASEKIIEDLSNAEISDSWMIPDGIEQAYYGYEKLSDLLNDVGIKMSDMALAAQGNADAMDRVTAVTDSMVAAGGKQRDLAGIILSYLDEEKTGYEQASEAAKAKKTAVDEVNAATGKSTEATAGNTAAQEANATATQEAADSQSILEDDLGATTKGINDQAAALGEVIDALSTYYGFALSESDAMISMHDAFDKATDSVVKNGQTLDLNTEQGRANQSALNDLAKSALKAAQAQAENGANMDQINGTLDQARQHYIDAAQAMGMTPEAAKAAADAAGLTRDQFDRLAQSVQSVPDDKKINVTVTDEASSILGNVKLNVDKINDKTVRISGDNADLMDKIAKANGMQVDPKTGTLDLDKNQFDVALALAAGAQISPKTGKLLGDNSDMFNKLAQANGWKIDSKTGYIYANGDEALRVVDAVNQAQVADKSFNVYGHYFTINEDDGMPVGTLRGPHLASGGTVDLPGYASGGKHEFTGPVTGPGTAISDSIWLANARLSDGEYVMRAAAVDRYGVNLFDDLNNMRYQASPSTVAASDSKPQVTHVTKTATINVYGNGKSDRAVAAEVLQTLRLQGFTTGG